MSSHTWVCFECRLAVRRPSRDREPRCANCGSTCTHLGTKIPVPPKSKPRAWHALRDGFFLRSRLLRMRAEQMHVALTHEIEREIARLSALPRNPGLSGTLRRLRQRLMQLNGISRNGDPRGLLFLPPVFLRHGIIALEQEIERLKRVELEVGDDWPADFDANDIPLLEIVLSSFQDHAASGYAEQHWNSKPVRFFFTLIPAYIEAHKRTLPEAELHLLQAIHQQYTRWQEQLMQQRQGR